MTNILGLQVQKVSASEMQPISILIKQREEFRAQKRYEEADKIREQIAAQNVVLLDHKNKTIWMKKERIPADT